MYNNLQLDIVIQLFTSFGMTREFNDKVVIKKKPSTFKHRSLSQKKQTSFNPFILIGRFLKRCFLWYEKSILEPINEFFAGCEIKPMFERNVEAFERAVKEKQQREGTSSPSEGGTPRGMFSEDPVMDSILKGQVFNQTHHGHKSSHDTHWRP